MNKQRTIRYTLAITVAAAVLLAVLAYVAHKDKTELQDGLSNRMNRELHELTGFFSANELYYEEIMTSGRVTGEKARILMAQYEAVRDQVMDYRTLAIDLNEREDDYTYDNTSSSAGQLSRLYFDWHHTFYNRLGDLELEPAQLEIVTVARELNAEWLEAMEGYRGVEFRVDRDEWLELLDGLENRTNDYLREQEMDSIEELWRVRDE